MHLRKRPLGFIFVVIAAILLVAACSESQQLPSSTLTVNGLEREYNLFVPSDLPDGPRPLLVVAHGGGGRGEVFPQQSQFEALAQSEGFLIAFPQAQQMPNNEGEWQLNTRPDSRHDIDYIGAMIEQISARHAVDPSRIYATGYSLGSMFTYELACHMSSHFAAIASFAGTMPQNMNTCDQERPVPIMHIHGRDDSIIAYGNTWEWKEWDSVGTMLDIPSLMTFWSDKYNCQEDTQTTSDATTHFVHSRCAQEARFEHHRLSGVGHGWPTAIDGVSTHQVIWTFLSEFSL